MPRNFASGDKIRQSAGLAATITGPVTLAIWAKTDSSRDGAWRNLMGVLSSAGAWAAGYALELSNVSNKMCFSPSSSATSAFSTTGTVAADGWCLHVVTKATGTATPRYHRYKASTGVWVHEAMDHTEGNSAGVSGGLIEIAGGLGASGDNFVGDVALAGMFDVDLAAVNDQPVEALAYTLNAWCQAKGLWMLDQASTSMLVTDLTGNGANQSAIVGTTVSTSSLPAFTYGAAVTYVRKYASGGSTTTLAATIASAGRVTAAVRETHRLATTIASKGAVTANLRETHKLATTIASKGAVTANLRETHKLASSIASKGTVTANLRETHRLAATIAAQGRMTAAARVTHKLASTIASKGRMTAALKATHKLASTIASHGSLVATLNVISSSVTAGLRMLRGIGT